ncbi:MAG TPA: hypothetical protein VF092_13185 [Longimicrobium sp.]
MPSIAWSTVAVLALLLPGFLFFTGLNTPEGFSRDLAPRNPLGTLSAVVLVSFVTHSVFTAISAMTGVGVDWAAALSVVQLSPPSGPVAAARAFAEHPWRVTTYIVMSSAAGLVCGAAAGMLVVGVKLRGKSCAPLRFLAQHRWVYELDPGRAETIRYVHVLADLGYDGRHVLYRGRLEGFGINSDGAFAYLLISGAQQRFLRLDHKDMPGGAVPHTGPLEAIGGGSSDPAHLVIAGAAIKNVVFQGMNVGNLRRTSPAIERAARLEAKAHGGAIDPAGELAKIRAIIREVAASLPENGEAAPTSAEEAGCPDSGPSIGNADEPAAREDGL